ncbi:rod shape-determining protein MreD [Clostridium sp. D2Q-14]|uniref:rod shape-determining protein MreD n=1 Tax=Anaeromonas gelatinilytica TaxID=2683194 RepID=UPI00193C214E|nr:rod shape-determining protein MreD [Anaeromonas gelatinilytica]MBS4535870.1 rod shape-determining protein MreD [Anaeromonas gelatinilytica]
MKIFNIVALFIASFILQSTIYQYIAIFDIMPNTNLILIILIALFTNKKVGGIVGLIIGMIQDILFGNVIGIHGLIYFFVGYLIGMANSAISKDNSIASFLLTFITTICTNILFFFIYYFSSANITFIQMLKEITIVEAIYNSILAIFLFRIVKGLFVSPSLKFSRKD